MEDVNSGYNTNTSQQGIFISNCDCGLEPVLREVKSNTINKGRFFWSCSKFGTPNHSRKCNFFKWKSQNDEDDNDPFFQYAIQSRTTSIPLHWRYKNSSIRATFPQAPGTPPTRSQSPFSVNSIDDELTPRNLTGDVYTRKPAVFDNWDDVPKFSTPQLLDIAQNHLMQQDRNYQRWYTANQLVKRDLEDARKEIEKSKRDFEMLVKENELYKREIKVLKAEKRRRLEDENVGIKEENQD
ncbi:50_t:CDS:2 [Funneliformis caledonium]|uniref:50_t:CDS:1 n=1 Tax=Funneliformis caledonium TaxID=1117310 RepID=A0A9N9GIE0_9GLOM|nr:50_t:CDS:2 [Funneliformis caledonium]